jgi:hypothetical protein
MSSRSPFSLLKLYKHFPEDFKLKFLNGAQIQDGRQKVFIV